MNTTDPSEFNDAIGTLGRMNSLWYNADEHSMNLDAHRWYHTLLPMLRELCTDMNTKKMEEANEYIKKIDPLLSEHIKTLQKNPGAEMPHNLYTELHKFDMFLREIYDLAGYKTKRKDDPKNALG